MKNKMNILDQIIEVKKQEVAQSRKTVPEEKLKMQPWYGRKCISLRSALLEKGAKGVIAEFKQKSPSKGDINREVKVEEVTKSYAMAGATGLSVLTDPDFFGGSLENFAKARETNPDIPILRKDFMIDSYQVTEAKAYGADIILLIAACLEKDKARELAMAAKSLGMEVLMEIHNEEELEILNEYVDMVGVNNRNLKTFKVDVETSAHLAKLIPDQYVKISESGLSEVNTIHYLREHGFQGFLIGETFMKTSNPGEACKNFISRL
jgi:indole-3-glycerol phosphate synthase